MNEVLVVWLGVTITPWKLVGYAGMLLFTARWFVQLAASKTAGKPVMPKMFWYMSIVGSLMLLGYFTFGRNDSVGILSNLFPFLTASYNLYLELKSKPAVGAEAKI
jgi:lipid-A-disaccharide synthase-like uncharacterized protein